MHQNAEQQPGAGILDRYMPQASAEEREAARENLRRLAQLVIRVHERLSREAGDSAIRPDRDSAVESELPSKGV